MNLKILLKVVNTFIIKRQTKLIYKIQPRQNTSIRSKDVKNQTKTFTQQQQKHS